MKTQEITTTNIADFGPREIKMLTGILNAWIDQGLPEDFEKDEVHPIMNRNTRHVFLTNSEYQSCTMNGAKLEMWHHCGNCGNHGFAEDCQLNDEGCHECCPAWDALRF